MDSVLVADKYAVGLDASYGTAYSAALWSKTKFTTTLFKNASHALAELIYSAWIDAGSPAFGMQTAVNVPNAVNVTVYPNPTNGILNLVGDNVLKSELKDITGKSMGLFYNNYLNINEFTNGIYILSIYSKDGLLKKEKIVLVK